ncbi:MAG: DeoR/GlpR transcriptional regulator [Anaerolineales bacterium]|uniref:DeoR/GlpR transcriptional regulator n=1 Tax=Candidatus Desulfolinea nitratireducens TaxID=2841698 RepID=A0A8J6NPT3_9CHLR|nr:DeoR/GlpR transcriptional regulator [Candidatus Desulfolinea nitratireducens]MBL6961361.1 DeoR/GlpR transcriptional regulator [Anaerolineales bacterium]
MSKLLIPAQRRERIQEYLTLHKIVRTVDLCEMLDASEATVRRDLEWLEQEGILEKTHGGAFLSQRMNIEPEYRQRAQSNPEQKRQIGAMAASLIETGDIVFINSGTTTTQVIHQIRDDPEISIFTNNFNAAHEMGEPGFHHFSIGGEYQPRSKSLAGRFAMENLKHVYANKAIIGVDGISLKYGCTVPSNGEAEVVRQMIERTTGDIIIVADHSKWGVVSNFQIATIDEVDVLITDEAIDKAAFKLLEAHSVKIKIAKAN